TRQGRHEHRAALDALIEEWTSGEDRYSLAAELTAAGVPASAVKHGGDIAVDPRLWRRGSLEMVDLTEDAPDLGVRPHIAAPWRYETTDLSLQEPAPTSLGRDNEYVFCELLGLSREELNRLEADGV